MSKVVVANLGAVGVIKDLPPHRLPPNAFTDATNAHFTIAGVEPTSPFIQVMDPIVGGLPAGMSQLNWLTPFPPATNPIWVYASIGSSKMMGTVTQSAGTWVKTDITRVSGPYNNIATQRWHANVFQGLGVFNQQEDIPQLWNPIATATRLIDMPNWTATNPEGVGCRVRTLRPYKNFLISMYVKNITSGADYPYRVRWSDPAPPGQSPATWDIADPANLSGEVDLAETPDHLIGGLTLGEIFIIYKEQSTWGMQFVGGSQVMRFWKIFSGSGMLFRDCFMAFPGGHFVVTQDDIIVHTGAAGSNKSIIQNTLRQWLTRNLNYAAYYNCYIAIHSFAQEIWFCFPTIGNTFANMALVWHWESGVIGLQDLPYSPFAVDGSVPAITAADTWG